MHTTLFFFTLKFLNFFVTEYLSKNNITTVKNRGAIGKRLKKTYFCADCGDCFLGKFALLDHINAVHDGKKSYICNTCGVRFAILSRLKEHVANVHEKKKPFKCSLCDYGCFYKGNMNKHINLKHPGETVEILYVSDDPFRLV